MQYRKPPGKSLCLWVFSCPCPPGPDIGRQACDIGPYFGHIDWPRVLQSPELSESADATDGLFELALLDLSWVLKPLKFQTPALPSPWPRCSASSGLGSQAGGRRKGQSTWITCSLAPAGSPRFAPSILTHYGFGLLDISIFSKEAT